LAVSALAFFFVRNYLLHLPLLAPNDRLMIAAIDNRTGDKTLDGVASSALNLELAQSPVLNLRQLTPLITPPPTPALARSAAQSAGAAAYLFGALASSGAAYTLSIEIRKTASDRTLATAHATAPTRADIPSAIDRTAAALLTALRLTPPTPTAPLAREATANLDALHAYSLGEAALLEARTDAHRTDDALAAFQSAAAFDPNFAQPQLQLAWLYASQHAEAAAASAARLAAAAAANTSPRTSLLAQYASAVNSTGDLAHAADLIQHLISLYPHDPEGARDFAQVLRLQGQFTAALDTAQRALDADPNDPALNREAELALIALDRYDDALALLQKSPQLNSTHDGIALTAAYLAHNPTLLATAIERVARPPRSSGSMAAYGLYLDDTGQLSAGETLWRATAAGLDSSSASAGSGPWLLAQGALDRAFAGDCPTALDLARTAIPTLTAASSPRKSTSPGPATTFNAGVAAALCGNKSLAQQSIAALTRNWPHASAVTGYYLPDLNAALALGQLNYPAALTALAPAAPSDLISLTPYLRGLAHLGLHQPQLAIADFESVLAHHGAALTSGSNVYPMAQIDLARAFAAPNGSQPADKPNSLQAYKNFLTLWPLADPANPLLREATLATR
jgi:serine/threonine-protein kinase